MVACGQHPYRLGSANPADNLTWGVGRADLESYYGYDDVATFTLNIKDHRFRALPHRLADAARRLALVRQRHVAHGHRHRAGTRLRRPVHRLDRADDDDGGQHL